MTSRRRGPGRTPLVSPGVSPRAFLLRLDREASRALDALALQRGDGMSQALRDLLIAYAADSRVREACARVWDARAGWEDDS